MKRYSDIAAMELNGDKGVGSKKACLTGSLSEKDIVLYDKGKQDAAANEEIETQPLSPSFTYITLQTLTTIPQANTDPSNLGAITQSTSLIYQFQEIAKQGKKEKAQPWKGSDDPGFLVNRLIYALDYNKGVLNLAMLMKIL